MGGRADMVLLKYASNGSLLYARQAGSIGSDSGQSLAIVDSNTIYIGGYAGGSMDGQVSAGGVDILLMKYNVNSTKLMTRLYGTAGNDSCYGLA
eukprot:scaffold8073_cov229-Ochromonas_danica.AAC.1